jgi:hypothetical protein
MDLFRRSAVALGVAHCLNPSAKIPTILNAAFLLRPQSVRTFAGHSQFANIKVRCGHVSILQLIFQPMLLIVLIACVAQESC